MLRRTLLVGSKCVARNSSKNPVSSACKSQVRRGHGHAKDAHSHSNEPYAIKHHDHYPDEAYAFGIKPGDAAEGWEYMTYGVYAACTLVLVIGLNSQPNGDFKAWARREALARETVIANGGEIQFGVYYNNKQYDEAGDCGDTMPTIKEVE